MPRTNIEKQRLHFFSSNVFYKFFLTALIIPCLLVGSIFVAQETYANPVSITTPDMPSGAIVITTPSQPASVVNVVTPVNSAPSTPVVISTPNTPNEPSAPVSVETPGQTGTSNPVDVQTPNQNQNDDNSSVTVVTPNQPKDDTPVTVETPNQNDDTSPVTVVTPNQPGDNDPIDIETPNKPKDDDPVHVETPNKPKDDTPIEVETPNKPKDDDPIDVETPNKPPVDNNNGNGGGNGSGGNGGGGSTGSSGGSGGGGTITQMSSLGTAYSTLAIRDEKVEYLINGAVLVTWKTSIKSTGQVLYSGDSKANSISPFDSYEFKSMKMNIPADDHIMIITDLKYGETYYFRPVSTTRTKKAIGKELVIVIPGTSFSKRDNTCEGGILENIRPGSENNPDEVIKLQNFLRESEGFEDVTATGVYDQTTREAVEDFQIKYSEEILAPWGVSEPTGFVYITTRKKINEILCDKTIPLSDSEIAEIENYKKQLEILKSLDGSEDIIDELEGLVGQADDDDDSNATTTEGIGRFMVAAIFDLFSDPNPLYLLIALLMVIVIVRSYPNLEMLFKKKVLRKRNSIIERMDRI